MSRCRISNEKLSPTDFSEATRQAAARERHAYRGADAAPGNGVPDSRQIRRLFTDALKISTAEIQHLAIEPHTTKIKASYKDSHRTKLAGWILPLLTSKQDGYPGDMLLWVGKDADKWSAISRSPSISGITWSVRTPADLPLGLPYWSLYSGGGRGAETTADARVVADDEFAGGLRLDRKVYCGGDDLKEPFSEALARGVARLAIEHRAL